MVPGCWDVEVWVSMSMPVNVDGVRWSLGFERPALARSSVPYEVSNGQL